MFSNVNIVSWSQNEAEIHGDDFYTVVSVNVISRQPINVLIDPRDTIQFDKSLLRVFAVSPKVNMMNSSIRAGNLFLVVEDDSFGYHDDCSRFVDSLCQMVQRRDETFYFSCSSQHVDNNVTVHVQADRDNFDSCAKVLHAKGFDRRLVFVGPFMSVSLNPLAKLKNNM